MIISCINSDMKLVINQNRIIIIITHHQNIRIECSKSNKLIIFKLKTKMKRFSHFTQTVMIGMTNYGIYCAVTCCFTVTLHFLIPQLQLLQQLQHTPRPQNMHHVINIPQKPRIVMSTAIPKLS